MTCFNLYNNNKKQAIDVQLTFVFRSYKEYLSVRKIQSNKN